jgi:hypothetical protein
MHSWVQVVQHTANAIDELDASAAAIEQLGPGYSASRLRTIMDICDSLKCWALENTPEMLRDRPIKGGQGV